MLYTEPAITFNGQKLAAVDKIVNFEITLSCSISIDKDVAYTTSRAIPSFGRLRVNVWERRGISLQTKLKVYRAVVLPSLLYASETLDGVQSAHQTAELI